MPIYVYKCPNCGKEEEVLQAPGESAPWCDDSQWCGKMEKQLTAANFQIEKAAK
jgi:putative FmdB family regulatory protein